MVPAYHIHFGALTTCPYFAQHALEARAKQEQKKKKFLHTSHGQPSAGTTPGPSRIQLPPTPAAS